MVFLTAFSGKAIASAAFIPKAVFGAMFVVTIGDFTIMDQSSKIYRVRLYARDQGISGKILKGRWIKISFQGIESFFFASVISLISIFIIIIQRTRDVN